MIIVKQVGPNYIHPTGVHMPNHWGAYDGGRLMTVDEDLEIVKYILRQCNLAHKVVLESENV